MSTRSRILLALLALTLGPLVGVGAWACVHALQGTQDAVPVGLIFGAMFLALSAAGAFVILVRDLWRSMDVLTTAATRIGGGDFTPWLPPPSHDEVGRLSFAIGTMAARLEHVMQQNVRDRQMIAIGELASHISHEIRNPLSSLKINLQSVERELRAGLVPSDLPDVVGLCLREIHRLDGTVHGVLRLAGTRNLRLEPCDLRAIVDDAVQTLRPQLEARGITLDVRLAATSVEADAAQLRGVVINLLLNAHDVLPDGGRVDVFMESRCDDANVVRLHVADDGPGISAEDRDRIFQPFYTTKPTGTGIGLPLSAQVVEAHGGRLVLVTGAAGEATDGGREGADFVIELPVSMRRVRRTGLRALRPWRRAAAAERSETAGVA